MRSLLPRVLTAFPNAKVVVTNYYQVVSEQSDPVYLWELLRVWDIIGPTLQVSQAWLMKKLAAQSFAFHDELTRGLRAVVPNARPLEVIARAAGAKVVQSGGSQRDAGGLAAPERRAALAEIPFGPQHSYAAPDTRLFYLNEGDPAASVRRQECMDLYGFLQPNCTLAAGGHPNLEGAAVYADAIIATLKQLVPEWAAATPKVDPRVELRPSRRP
jgi:hypothetical protein